MVRISFYVNGLPLVQGRFCSLTVAILTSPPCGAHQVMHFCALPPPPYCGLPDRLPFILSAAPFCRVTRTCGERLAGDLDALVPEPLAVARVSARPTFRKK